MTIKDFLLSIPENKRFRIDYLFENHCPYCRRYITELDEEYSTDGTGADFRHEVDDANNGIWNHYRNYIHVYEFETDDNEVEITETDTETVIIITMPGDERTCEECEDKRLEEYAEIAEED